MSCMSEHAFLQSILDDTGADLPRLVYADWLEEQGQAARAELIRVQCSLAAYHLGHPQRRNLEDREHALLSQYESNWLMLEPGLFPEWEFRRGFVEQITGGPSAIVACNPAFFAHHPITRWTLQENQISHSDLEEMIESCEHFPDWASRLEHIDCSSMHWDVYEALRLASRDCFQKLKSLDLSGNTGISSLARELARFTHAHRIETLALGGRSGVHFRWADGEHETLDTMLLVKNLARAPLAELTLYDCGLSSEGLRQILLASFSTTLRRLDISDNPIAPDAWRAFQFAHPDLKLDKLDVSGTPLANISLGPVLESKPCESLRMLEINRCGSARVNMEVVSHSAYWSQATQLRAHGGTIPAATLAPLCQGSGPRDLQLLDLADNYIRTEGVELLCQADWSRSITWLGLSRNYLDDDSLTVLADAHLPRLHTLHLAHNNLDMTQDRDNGDGEVITDVGLNKLIHTPGLANLRVLTLGYTGVTDRSVEGLVHGPHWELYGLGLDGCDLSDRAIQTLAKSPRLARIEWLSLAGNPRLSGDTLLPLAESPYLSPRCELDIGGVYANQRVITVLRERLGPRLSY